MAKTLTPTLCLHGDSSAGLPGEEARARSPKKISFELDVFERFTLRFGDRIFGFQFLHFLNQCLAGIDVQVVGKEENGVETVGKLVGDFSFALFDGLGELLALFPLEDFEKFRGFNGEIDGQFFGSMELGPVARGAESKNDLGKRYE